MSRVLSRPVPFHVERVGSFVGLILFALTRVAVAQDAPGTPSPSTDPESRAGPALTVTVRTAPGRLDGTNEPVSFCLTGTPGPSNVPATLTCRRLDTPDWDDRRHGRVDVYHLGPLPTGLAGTQGWILRTARGVDTWGVDCVEVALDGVPVSCEDDLGAQLGLGRGARRSLARPFARASGTCGGCWESPLTHGPLLGAVTPTGARIRVRTHASVPVRLLLEGQPIATAVPSPAEDFAHTFALEGLEPGRRYAYTLEAGGVPAGPFAFTTPAAGPAPMRLAFGSCALFDDDAAFSAIRSWAPDVFVFAGDAHYGETDARAAHRAQYRAAQERPARGALMREAITLATWDDHDFTGNNTGGADPARDEVLAAFREAWANGSYGTPGAPGVYSAWEGNGVQVVLLDVRYARDLEGSVLGAAQEAWLERVVRASPAVFHLIVSGSQWTHDGNNDSWTDWPAAQDRVLDLLSGIPGVVLLDGDVHRAEFRSVRAAGYDLPALTSSPLSNVGSPCPGGDEEIACYTGSNYFIGLEIDPTQADPVLTARIHEVGGGVLETWELRASELRPLTR